VDAKKQARAERFGTAAAATSTAAAGRPKIGLSHEVLKKRAERFGIPLSGPAAANELAEKKRLREERFGAGAGAKKAKA